MFETPLSGLVVIFVLLISSLTALILDPWSHSEFCPTPNTHLHSSICLHRCPASWRPGWQCSPVWFSQRHQDRCQWHHWHHPGHTAAATKPSMFKGQCKLRPHLICWTLGMLLSFMLPQTWKPVSTARFPRWHSCLLAWHSVYQRLLVIKWL
jgi:hypothetical protein